MTSGLIIGIDTCADSRNKAIVYSALVANMQVGSIQEKTSSVEYFSCVSKHASVHEAGNATAHNILKALTAYKQSCGKFPKDLLIYRDGVGDGKLANLEETELNYLRDLLNSFYGEKTYNVIFTVVSKRIRTRIFLDAGKENGGNPYSGTVVDDVITLPNR